MVWSKKIMKLQEIVYQIDKIQLKNDLPLISVGDTVKIGVLIQEGKKQEDDKKKGSSKKSEQKNSLVERIQPYEGTVIAQHKAGIHSTITVRRIFQGVGVERVFTIHSPFLKTIQIIQRAQVRKAKLYYLRNRVGKATRLKRKN
uniref:Large ribosomal subunit protein bL19c n=2 Tax=Lobosphaera incisa TaxID=312850 RepID=A0A0U1XP37_9CHLO|nr:ribosomal protein L19 [Lobosphaera incisa]